MQETYTFPSQNSSIPFKSLQSTSRTGKYFILTDFSRLSSKQTCRMCGRNAFKIQRKLHAKILVLF